MFFQGCVQKCEFGMENTTTVLSRNANLAVKGLTQDTDEESSMTIHAKQGPIGAC